MHNIEYSSYPENIKRDYVQSELDDYVSHETWQEGGCGLGRPIRWLDRVCESYEDAELYIKTHDKGWYDQLAVKYKQVKKAKTSKLAGLEKAVKEQRMKLWKLENEFYFADSKSKFKGCKKCGSSISVEYLNGRNICPVCGEDLRPDTYKQKEQREKDKLKSL